MMSGKFRYSPLPKRFCASFSRRNRKAWACERIEDSGNVELGEASPGLNYGQHCFEALKAFRCKNGSIGIFRAEDHANRLCKSSNHILIPPPPLELTLTALKETVIANKDYITAEHNEEDLFLRVILYGSNSSLPVGPADKFEMRVFASLVGPLYPPNFQLLVTDFDRAAPNGSGHVKIGANYAACFQATNDAKNQDCHDAIFRCSYDRRLLEETSSANLLIEFKNSKERLVTPKSHTILPSITMNTLEKLSERVFGQSLVRRQITVDELNSATGVACVGTAAGVSKVCAILTGERKLEYPLECQRIDTLKSELHKARRGLVCEDQHWLTYV